MSVLKSMNLASKLPFSKCKNASRLRMRRLSATCQVIAASCPSSSLKMYSATPMEQLLNSREKARFTAVSMCKELSVSDQLLKEFTLSKCRARYTVTSRTPTLRVSYP